MSDRDETSSRLRVGAWLPPAEVPEPGGHADAAAAAVRRDAPGRGGRSAGHGRNSPPGRDGGSRRDFGTRRAARTASAPHRDPAGRATAGDADPDADPDETREQPLPGHGRRRASRLPQRPVLLAGAAVALGVVVLLVAVMFTMGGGPSRAPVVAGAASSSPSPEDTSNQIHVLNGSETPSPLESTAESAPGQSPAPSASKSAARVQLGPVDVNGYCRAHGFARAVLLRPATGTGAAYNNWACESRNGKQRALLPMNDACQWEYGSPATAVAENPNDANSWRCYR